MNTLYFLILLILIGINFVYPNDVYFSLLLTIIAIPIISLIVLIISKKYINIANIKQPEYSYKKEKIQVVMGIQNNGIIPIAVGEIEFTANIYKHGECFSEQKSVELPLKARNAEQLLLKFSSDELAYIEIVIKCIRIRDFLSLFCLKKRFDESCNIAVIPRFMRLSDEKNIHSTDFSESKMILEKTKIPFKDSYFDGVREYRLGDKLSAIHHKLSAKSDIDYVKNITEKENNTILLQIKLKSLHENIEENVGINEQILDIYTKYAISLLESNTPFYTYLHGYSKDVVKTENRDDFVKLLINIIESYSKNKYKEYNIDCIEKSFKHIIVFDENELNMDLSKNHNIPDHGE
ncbi:MAG: DUF58 domain-containing protein [Oscillospiraceae bacterium]|jgi:hypothetical protein|nr:DUF58 domain-containing protein [Oscillospiraceae bacterium]